MNRNTWNSSWLAVRGVVVATSLVIGLVLTPPARAAPTPDNSPGYVVITTLPDPAWLGVAKAEQASIFHPVWEQDYSPTSDGLIIIELPKGGKYAIKNIDTLAPGADKTSANPGKLNYEVDDDKWILFDAVPGRVLYLGNFVYDQKIINRLVFMYGAFYRSFSTLRFGLTRQPEDLARAKALLQLHRPELADRLEPSAPALSK